VLNTILNRFSSAYTTKKPTYKPIYPCEHVQLACRNNEVLEIKTNTINLQKLSLFGLSTNNTRVNFSQGLVKRITNAHKQTIKMVNMNMAHTKTYLQGIRSVGHKHWQRTKYKWYFLSYLSLQKDTSNLRCQSSDDNEQHCRCGAYKHETKILANINVLVPHFHTPYESARTG